MWWSNRADDSNSRLTRQFDLTAVQPGDSIEMEIAMWFNIETDYDYGYVVVSSDGEKWTILPGQQTTTDNPSGNSFGDAYTDVSRGSGGAPVWITERFDLSASTPEKKSMCGWNTSPMTPSTSRGGSSTTSASTPSTTPLTSKTAPTAGKAKAGCLPTIA
ncbi:MAG: immune inhibitor A [Caldilineaceae bacterium]